MADRELQRATAMVRRETFVNTVMTAVIAAALTWLIFRKENAIEPLGPPPTGIFGILPGTFNFTLLVTIALTLLTRKRVSAGLYPRIAPADNSIGWRLLPRNVIFRAILLALFATLVFVSAGFLISGVGVHTGVWSSPWSFSGVMVFFVSYFVVVSLVVTPIVIWRALAD